MKRQTYFLCSLLLSLGVFGSASAEDTEIYLSLADETTGSARPKVLIIFDNSISMGFTVEGVKPVYNSGTTYPTQGTIDSDRIYWSTTGSPPPTDTNQYFSKSINRCDSSSTNLGDGGNGVYTDKLLLWGESTTRTCDGRVWNGRCFARINGRWTEIPWTETTTTDWQTLDSSFDTALHLDCYNDVHDEDNLNPGITTEGYPSRVDPAGPYGCTEASCSNVNFSNGYTLYTANYMNFWYGGGSQDRTRLDIAQEVVTNIVNSNKGVDFGLMVYNYNDGSHNGGRVVKRIIPDMTSTDRTALNTIIDGLDDETYTPMCETSYEAFRYLTGQEVWYGDDKASGDTPDRDTAAEDPSGVYDSPIGSCQNAYVILMTDGFPYNDTAANDLIEGFTGTTCGNYQGQFTTEKNCLPDLAEYMYTHDLDGNNSNGTQKVKFYTIGFTTDQVLLEETATNGGGRYFRATDPISLTTAFQGAILDILSGTSTFTSPAVAVNSFNRTESRNEVFLAMFEPKEGIRWPGNLKKLKVGTDASGNLEWQDKNSAAAMDSDTGNIKDTATTYWSTTVDGSTVEKGGAGQLLAERTSARNIWTNTGTNGALESFTSANIDVAAFASMGITDEAGLLQLFGVANTTELANVISWARGVDVLDEDGNGDSAENRPWILGDSLHSRPLAINYGCNINSDPSCEPDIRVVVGTNEGVLHMFNNGDGNESWAFIPKELARVLKHRMDNSTTGSHIYGIDGSPVTYIKDVNRDGYIDYSAGDRVYLYFGLRRGGRAIYAMDVSQPDSPSFKWMKDETSDNFGELGLTWSTPQVATAPGQTDPVLIFGGGYDTNKDSTSSIATADSMGRAVFIVNANTGSLIKGFTYATDNALIHGIAAPVNAIDSDGDGVDDRIYAADTGGNIWRVDMTTSTTSNWKIRKLAAFNGGAAASDRRFFNQPDVVREPGYDVVLIGSGDRTNPLATDVTNRFYAIRDKATYPYYNTTDPTSTECSGGSADFRCQMPLDETKMHNATANLIQQGTGTAQSDALTELYDRYGWYIDLEASGEKSLASSITFNGVTYFTTYAPNQSNANACIPGQGTAKLYAVSTLDASAVFDFTGNGGDLTKEDRSIELGSMILDTPSIYVDDDGNIRLFLPAGGTGGKDDDFIDSDSSSIDPNSKLKPPTGTFWYMKDE